MTKIFLPIALIMSISIPWTSAFAEKVIVDVKGLVCEFCAVAIEKVFKKRGEVKSIDVNLTSKKITIEFKQGKNIQDLDIKRLILDSGYNVVKITRSP